MIDNNRSVCGDFNVSYGEGLAEKMDIWGNGRLPDRAPIIAMIHGGYWQVTNAILQLNC